MRTIEIADDLYEHIAASTQEIGESASNILRRLLDIREFEPVTTPIAFQRHELSDMLEMQALKRFRGEPLDRMLIILREVYQTRTEQFENLGELGGSKRIYLSKSKDQILASGNNTNPRQIPDTPFWVYTNSSTPEKKKFLHRILAGTGYSSVAITAAMQVLVSGG